MTSIVYSVRYDNTETLITCKEISIGSDIIYFHPVTIMGLDNRILTFAKSRLYKKELSNKQQKKNRLEKKK